MSIVKRALPEKLLIETQDLKLKMYSNPDLMCQGGSDEENEEYGGTPPLREVIRKINFREVDEVVSGPETVTRKDHPTPSMPLSSPLVSSSSSCTDIASSAGTRGDTLDLNESEEEKKKNSSSILHS